MAFMHALRQTSKRQHGIAALFLTIVALFVITLATMFANRGAMFEQITSANQHRYTQAFEAAQGGVDYAIAWLGTQDYPNGSPYTIATGDTGAVWLSDTTYAPYNEKNAASIATQSLGGYTATTTLWRNSANPRLVEIVSVATGEATATVRQIVDVNALGFTTPNLPALVVNGCINNITGTPVIAGDVESSGPLTTTCLNTGHFAISGTATVPSDFPATPNEAWARIFGSATKADILAMAKAQPDGQVSGPIYYYNNDPTNPATNTPDPWHASLGTADSPVILIFDRPGTENCPKITGGPTIYGIVYCKDGLDMQGWGATNIFGSLVTDSAITKYTANTTITATTNAGLPTSYPVSPVISKVTGSWRDF